MSPRIGYSNPDDKLMDQQQGESDPVKRAKLLHQLGRILKEDAPWVPLWNLADIYGTASNIKWAPRSDERIRTWEMTITE